MEKKITVGRVLISPLDVVSRSWLRSRGATRSDVDFAGAPWHPAPSCMGSSRPRWRSGITGQWTARPNR